MLSQNQRENENKKDEFKRVKSNLLLRITDITNGGAPTTDYFNNVGSVENLGARATWNMDWKCLLGNNYNRYSVFGIRLNVFAAVASNWSTANAAGYPNQVPSIQMSGLNWVNNGYNSATQSNTGRCVLGTTVISTGFSSFQVFPSATAEAFFSRPGQNDPVTIELFQTVSNNYIVPTGTTVAIPQYVVLFDIYPVY
jgi:hypothetical protein